MAGWAPNPNDLRPDGSMKGYGFLGGLERPDGGVSSELSIGVNLGGRETEIPTLVPTLSQQEIDYLLRTPEDQTFTANPTLFRSIEQKAIEHAKGRIGAGKSPFYGSEDSGVGMGTGHYSMGGMDPLLMQQIAEYTTPSPYASQARQDPSFAPAVAQHLAGIASGGGGGELLPAISPDMATGVAQPLLSDHGDGGPSAMQIVGGIMTAPLRAFGLARETLEDALGHPNARRRSAQDAQVEMMTKLGLVSSALTPEQKAVIWPDRYVQDQAAYSARSGADGGDLATGRNTSGLPLPEPRKTGFVDWLTGETRRQREQQLAQAAMVKRAIEMNFRTEQLRSEQALGDLRRTQTEGAQWDVTQGYKYGDLEKQAGLGKDYAAIEASRANAAQSYASADYSRAAIGNLGADNARADEAARRAAEKSATDQVTEMLRQRGMREGIRQTKLENRGKVLDLRAKESGGDVAPFGPDTAWDSYGRAFKRSQFNDDLNAASGKSPERRAEVLKLYHIPMKKTAGYFGTDIGSKEEIDDEAMSTPPARRPVQTFDTSGQPDDETKAPTQQDPNGLSGGKMTAPLGNGTIRIQAPDGTIYEGPNGAAIPAGWTIVK